jgi:glycosyltransferase involved in cell wall biosynthesis
MVLLSHPTGNANVRAALNGFNEAKMLFEFDTTIASFPGTWLHNLSHLKPFAEIGRRNFDIALKTKTKTYPWYEIARLVSLKAKLKSLTKHEAGVFCIDSIYKQHDLFVSKRIGQLGSKISSVYAYEDGCLQTFQQARSMGIICSYDLPIGYWRTSHKILEEEKKRWPQWAATLVGVKNSSVKLARKDEELALADEIYVASSFTAKTLNDYPGSLKNVHVVPYGFPPVTPSRDYSIKRRPLKILFVGGLSQRKGIADLFEVTKQLKGSVSLTVVGHKPSQSCDALNNALATCNYISSLPHHQILKLMREHDVLVFPSVFEGFGLVVTEAMSQGTPVVTTYNTCGADLIDNGKNGWLINAGSTEQLKKSLEQLLENPDHIASNGLLAMETASKRPWHLYGEQLSQVVNRKLTFEE